MQSVTFEFYLNDLVRIVNRMSNSFCLLLDTSAGDDDGVMLWFDYEITNLDWTNLSAITTCTWEKWFTLVSELNKLESIEFLSRILKSIALYLNQPIGIQIEEHFFRIFSSYVWRSLHGN